MTAPRFKVGDTVKIMRGESRGRSCKVLEVGPRGLANISSEMFGTGWMPEGCLAPVTDQGLLPSVTPRELQTSEINDTALATTELACNRNSRPAEAPQEPGTTTVTEPELARAIWDAREDVRAWAGLKSEPGRYRAGVDAIADIAWSRHEPEGSREESERIAAAVFQSRKRSGG